MNKIEALWSAFGQDDPTVDRIENWADVESAVSSLPEIPYVVICGEALHGDDWIVYGGDQPIPDQAAQTLVNSLRSEGEIYKASEEIWNENVVQIICSGITSQGLPFAQLLIGEGGIAGVMYYLIPASTIS